MVSKDRPLAARVAKRIVRASVELDHVTHAKLCALAALEDKDRSELAAGFIRAGLEGFIVEDTRGG
jgi:hypothetical protein